jgi:hypothetical protein
MNTLHDHLHGQPFQANLGWLLHNFGDIVIMLYNESPCVNNPSNMKVIYNTKNSELDPCLLHLLRIK